MGLIEQIRKDIIQYTNNSTDFAVNLVFVSPENVELETTGYHTRHHLSIDTDGNLINSRKAHISIAEKNFIDAGYSIRNAKNDVTFTGHFVKVINSTSVEVKYIVNQAFPNETIGLITLILSQVKV